MKKLICLVLIALTALSFAACTNTLAPNPDNQTNPVTEGPGSVINPQAGTSAVVSNPTTEAPGNTDDATASFPLVFTHKWSLENVKSEDNPDGTLAYSYGGFAYDPTAEIVLEYCKDTDRLFTALKGYSDWPTELNDTWRGYGYVGIDNTEKASIRTLAVGKYGEKHAKVILDYENALYKDGFQADDKINASPKEEGKSYVNYCMLVAEGDVTINQIATAAYNALYLQAWHLVPADNQGVLISANGKTYTVNDILKELAG